MNIYETMQALMQKDEKETKEFMVDWLTPYYTKENITNTINYVLCRGNIDVAVIVHLDTVKEINRQDAKLYYDEKRLTMFCPGYPGFDDKSGLLILMLLIEKGYFPHIILTTGEEQGGLGSIELIQDYPFCPFEGVKYLLQIDRKGKNEFVTYDCDNKSFNKYISSFGWKRKFGTFSDIGFLAPAWGVAACNVSAAYLNEHTMTETLHINWLYEIVNKIEDMLKNTHKISRFGYVEKRHIFSRTIDTDFVRCDACENMFAVRNIEWVTIGDTKTQIPMCSKCRKTLQVMHCKKCKEYYWNPEGEENCPHCEEE